MKGKEKQKGAKNETKLDLSPFTLRGDEFVDFMKEKGFRVEKVFTPTIVLLSRILDAGASNERVEDVSRMCCFPCFSKGADCLEFPDRHLLNGSQSIQRPRLIMAKEISLPKKNSKCSHAELANWIS